MTYKAGWPTHRTEMHVPDGQRILVSEEFPIKRLREKHYCKYCYSTHRQWFLMDRKRYVGDDLDGRVLLCGKCEHTSLKD
jgi:hypothetical protein